MIVCSRRFRFAGAGEAAHDHELSRSQAAEHARKTPREPRIDLGDQHHGRPDVLGHEVRLGDAASVAPALAGFAGRALAELRPIRLSAPIGGRGGYTHLALVRSDGEPLKHGASSMLRGLAQAAGFAVVAPGTDADDGDEVPLVPLPLFAGETP